VRLEAESHCRDRHAELARRGDGLRPREPREPGGQARFTVDASDDELEALVGRLPACTSSDYGTPFYEIFKRYDNDFYRIDPMLFSPAEVWLTSSTTGRTFHAGHVAPDILRASLA